MIVGRRSLLESIVRIRVVNFHGYLVTGHFEFQECGEPLNTLPLGAARALFLRYRINANLVSTAGIWFPPSGETGVLFRPGHLSEKAI